MSTLGLELRSYLRLKILPDRFGIAVVQLRLEALYLLDAQLVNLAVDLHVLLLGEDYLLIARAQECLERLQRVLSQILPLL